MSTSGADPAAPEAGSVAQTAVEEPSNPEQDGHQEGKLRMLRGADDNVGYAIDGPSDTSDQPDPGGFSHTVF